jgi:hypothetical protein
MNALTASSTYYKKGGYLHVVVAVEDESTYHPELVTVGNVKVYRNGHLVRTVAFNRQDGTSEGTFNVFHWNTIAAPDRVDVVVTLQDDTELATTSTVQQLEDPDDSWIGPNTDTPTT